jgi:two-component system sensor histidine kinase UhpB
MPKSMQATGARFPWRGSLKWSLGALVVLPLAIALPLSGFALYATARADLEAELQSRAKLVASALAESAQYDLLRGSKGAARRSMQSVVAADPSIRQITLLDASREPILAFGDVSSEKPYGSVEVPVRALADAEALGDLGMPTPQGFVRVHVGSSGFSAPARGHLLMGLSGVLFAFLLAFAVGWWLLVRLHRPLQAALDSIRDLAYGESAAALTPPSGDELTGLQGAIRQVAHNLASAEQRQHERVAVQTRDLQVAMTHAMRADREKQSLLEYGSRLVEEERQRIAVELHDSLNAELISVRLRAEAIHARAMASSEADIAQMAQRIVATTNALYDNTRSIVRQLRPELLDTLGLGGAIEEMVRRLGESQPDCRFEYHTDESVPSLSPPLAMNAYRVIQEALTNIVRHARATQVTVTLDKSEPPHHVQVVIADNGRGLASGSGAGAGLGLIGMRERVAASGGVFSIASGDSGTIVTVLL